MGGSSSDTVGAAASSFGVEAERPGPRLGGSRDRNERLIEMKQIKGQSETHSLLWPNDEFASYEIMSFLIGLPEDSGRIPHIVGSYARQALKDGLTMQDTRRYNPYKFGVIGGSDSHNTGARRLADLVSAVRASL